MMLCVYSLTALRPFTAHKAIVFTCCLAIAVPIIWLCLGRFELSLLSQCFAVAIILGSLQLLVGMGGIISFGHALYVGSGAYGVVHIMRLCDMYGWGVPLVFLPFFGGLAGLLMAIPAGWLSTRRSHAIYTAMVSLALSELVYALAQMWPTVFGDERGFFINRAHGNFGALDFTDERLVVLLALLYMCISLFALHKIAASPLGKWLVAVREDTGRVCSLGMYPKRIQYMAFLISGFFAGVGGGALAIEFESVQSSMFSAANSGYYLMFAYLGGLSSAVGSMIGAIMQVLGLVWFPSVTEGAQLYLGLLFIYVVLRWPDGMAGAVAVNWQECKRQWLKQRFISWDMIVRLLMHLILLAGVICTVELVYGVRNEFDELQAVQPFVAHVLLLMTAVAAFCISWTLSFILKRLGKSQTHAQMHVQTHAKSHEK